MKKFAALIMAFVALICVAAAQESENNPLKLKPEQTRAAIAFGKQFKSRDQFLDNGLKRQKLQISSAWAVDGISKYLLFFTDYDVVAAASTAANQQMRELNDDDVKKLPLSGLLHVNVLLHGRGSIPVARLRANFGGEGPHLVIQMGDTIIQPVAKNFGSDTGVIPPSGPVQISVYNVGNTSYITEHQLGWSQERLEVEFAFQLPPEALQQKVKAILIDTQGKRYPIDIDLRTILHSQQ
jgi:hypothetical protein